MNGQKVAFVAGATGVIGIRLCQMLVGDNWLVYGTTRDIKKTKILQDIGVEAVVVDVYDEMRLEEVVASAKPDIVIHQLTDLPAGLDPEKMEAALVSNAKLREIGTKNLINAAVKAGVKKIIAQSIAFVY
jgi:nucleoside-diphosphate-sugar epimerase